MTYPLKTFICYAHEDQEVVEAFNKQLFIFEKQGLLQIWSQGKILPGEHWDKSIKAQLEKAEIILLFVSVDFINSNYIEIELQTAIQRHRDGRAKLIPIIVRPCHWESYFDIGQFQALPIKARPILSSYFRHLDEAFFEIAVGVKKTAEDIQEKKLADAAHAKAEAIARAEAELNAAKIAAAAERQRMKDEVAWKAAAELDTVDSYEAYLDSRFTLHKLEAEQLVYYMTAEQIKHKAEQKSNEKDLLENEENEIRINEAIENERLRIATTIHDGVGGLLVSAKWLLESAIEKTQPDSPVNQMLIENVRVVDAGYQEMRKIVYQLQDPVNEWWQSLKLFCERLSNDRTKIQFNILNVSEGIESLIGEEARLITQELITNALKHAKAAEINISLHKVDKILSIIVEDNGVGFNQQTVVNGIGFRSIQERVKRFNGSFKTKTKIGLGSTFSITIPLNN